MKGWIIGAGLLLLAAGCKDREACERSRLDLAKTWEELKSSAASLKYARSDEGATLSGVEKEDRVKHWGQLEERAALLESAFISKQVTWSSAEKALDELSEEYKAKPPQGSLAQGFGQGLDEATKAFEAFRAQCK